MNPYEAPKADGFRMRERGIHGVLAAFLMMAALILRFGVPLTIAVSGGSDSAGSLVLFSILGAVLWLWGCCHLAMHFGLSGAWGLAGILFLLGPAIIFWAANQKPKWDRAAARRPKGTKREYKGDPTSLY